MKKFFVITSKAYTSRSLNMGLVVELEEKDIEEFSKSYEVKPFKTTVKKKS